MKQNRTSKHNFKSTRSLKTKRKGPAKRYFVTCATANATVDKKFLAAIQNWCDEENGELIVLLGPPHRGSGPRNEAVYDKVLQPLLDSGHATVEFAFNKNLQAIDAQLNPQQLNPLTGMDHYGVSHKTGASSVIFGHPIQVSKPQAVGVATLPRILWTTGALTRPNGYQYNRIGKIAESRHVLGGLIVEIDGPIYHARHVQADKKGSFVTLGRRYFADKKSKEERPLFMKLGDIHVGFEDALSEKATTRLLHQLRPHSLRLEDLIDFESISHHTHKDPIAISKRKFKTLDSELQAVQAYLLGLGELRETGVVDRISCTHSNHSPDHLMRYLKEWRFIDDGADNTRTGVKIMNMVLNDGLSDQDLLAALVDPSGICEWPRLDTSERIEGFEVNCHGHLGINGSRGSPGSVYKAFGPCAVGHSHTPGVYPGPVLYSGTYGIIRRSYVKGSTTALNAHTVIYKGGHFEIINIIEGRYCLPRK